MISRTVSRSRNYRWPWKRKIYPVGGCKRSPLGFAKEITSLKTSAQTHARVLLIELQQPTAGLTQPGWRDIGDLAHHFTVPWDSAPQNDLSEILGPVESLVLMRVNRDRSFMLHQETQPRYARKETQCAFCLEGTFCDPSVSFFGDSAGKILTRTSWQSSAKCRDDFRRQRSDRSNHLGGPSLTVLYCNYPYSHFRSTAFVYEWHYAPSTALTMIPMCCGHFCLDILRILTSDGNVSSCASRYPQYECQSWSSLPRGLW